MCKLCRCVAAELSHLVLVVACYIFVARLLTVVLSMRNPFSVRVKSNPVMF